MRGFAERDRWMLALLQKPGHFRTACQEDLKWIVPVNERPGTRQARGLPRPCRRATGRALMTTDVEPQNRQAMVTACDSFESSIPSGNLPEPKPGETTDGRENSSSMGAASQPTFREPSFLVSIDLPYRST